MPAADALAKYRKAKEPSALERYLLNPAWSAIDKYFTRQGDLAHDGLAYADQGARQVRGGDLSGLAGMALGPLGYLSSPINALLPTEQEVYNAPDLPEYAKPTIAGGLMGAAMMLPGNKKGMGAPRTLYHGTREDALNLTNDRPLYLTAQEAEARGYAQGQHLGGTGVGKPQVLAYQAKEGNALNIDDQLFEAMDAGDDLDAVINAAAQRAKAEGYRYLEYTHPGFTPGQEQAVTVSLFPKDDLIGNAPKGITAMLPGSKKGMGRPRTFDFSDPGTRGARQAVIGDTTIDYGVGKDGLVEVTLIKTPKAKRGQGSARAAMSAMIEEADEAGLRLGLHADPMDAGVSKPRLETFYKSLGFKRNAGNKRDFSTRLEYLRENRPPAKAVEEAVPEGITAYHGSPHTFDKFSMDKIGTGEGAQAYGHGLYFAENEGVAKSYRDALAKPSWSVPPEKIAPELADLGFDPKALDLARDTLRALKGDGFQAVSALDGMAMQRGNATAREAASAIRSFHRNAKAADGSMYQVRLNVKPDELLDWDRPLSEQSKTVQEVVKQFPEEFRMLRDPTGAPAPQYGEPLGHEFYNKVAGDVPQKPNFNARNPTQATDRLRAAGIKGIRYKDAGSRPLALAKDPATIQTVKANIAKAEQSGDKKQASHLRGVLKTYEQQAQTPETYNYVIFDDKLVDILKRYGVAITAGAGGAAIVSGQDMPPEVAAQLGPQT